MRPLNGANAELTGRVSRAAARGVMAEVSAGNYTLSRCILAGLVGERGLNHRRRGHPPPSAGLTARDTPLNPTQNQGPGAQPLRAHTAWDTAHAVTHATITPLCTPTGSPPQLGHLPPPPPSRVCTQHSHPCSPILLPTPPHPRSPLHTLATHGHTLRTRTRTCAHKHVLKQRARIARPLRARVLSRLLLALLPGRHPYPLLTVQEQLWETEPLCQIAQPQGLGLLHVAILATTLPVMYTRTCASQCARTRVPARVHVSTAHRSQSSSGHAHARLSACAGIHQSTVGTHVRMGVLRKGRYTHECAGVDHMMFTHTHTHTQCTSHETTPGSSVSIS